MESSFTHTTYEITNADGNIIWCQRWTPTGGNPRAVIFLAHGFSEHCQYYVPLAEELASQQMVVYTHDHIGHGRSEGERALISSVDIYVRDVYQHVDLLHLKYSSSLFFLVGHSMGGAISYQCATRRPTFFRGVVLIGPALIPDPNLATPFKVKMARMVGGMFPSFPISPLLNDLVTRDKEAVKRLNEDPLRFHGYVKAGWGVAMIDAMEEMRNTFKDTRWPFLILQGGDDKVCAVQGAELLYNEAMSKVRKLKVYPKAYHCLHLEPEGVAEEMVKDVVDWISERTK